MSRDDNRPYPEGIAWDEAWRQRQRADAAEDARDKLAEIVRGLAEAPENMGPTFRAGYLTQMIKEARSLWSKMQKEAGMSKRELWEIVRADELQPDDTIRLDIYSHAIQVDRIIRGGGLVEVYPSKDSLSHRQPVLRRIPDADDPRVLRRALEMAVNEIEARDRYGTSPNPKEKDFIDHARRELESEGSDDQA